MRNLSRIGKRHFVTLFVRDNQHGTTSSYETLQISAPSQPFDSRPVSSRQKVDKFHLSTKSLKLNLKVATLMLSECKKSYKKGQIFSSDNVLESELKMFTS